MYSIFSNDTRTTLAMGLGTCQEKKTKGISMQKTVSGCQQFQNNGSSNRRATHSVAWETTPKSKVPKTTLNVALNNKFYTSEQQLAFQSSMSVNCAD